MRPPHALLESRLFQFQSLDEMFRTLHGQLRVGEELTILRLWEAGLPPITSPITLGAMLGINPGLIWSFVHRTDRHYRMFTIPKGNRQRLITAPRVALKLVQKWLSVQLQPIYVPSAHVFGFIPGRSHIDAAEVHCGARWIFSIDIADFFPSTPLSLVKSIFMSLGYEEDAAELLSRICCLRDVLPQGAPTSPLLSNLCFNQIDAQLAAMASVFGVGLSRYADDIVFSGVSNGIPDGLREAAEVLFEGTPWKLSPHKTEYSQSPSRLKVHGLLVHGPAVRLTKGYRYRIRALEHLRDQGKILIDRQTEVDGHIKYAKYVAAKAGPEVLSRLHDKARIE